MRYVYDLDKPILSGKKIFEGYVEGTRQPVIVKHLTQRCFLPDYDDGGKDPLELRVLLHLQGVPGVVKLLDHFSVSQDVTAIVLEKRARCLDLFDLIGFEKRLREDRARRLFRQAVRVLQRCLDAGVYHGDVKSENFVVDLHTLELILIDFGMSIWNERGRMERTGNTNPERTYPERTNLERTNLERTNLERTNLERTNLGNTNPERTNLERTNPEITYPGNTYPGNTYPGNTYPEITYPGTLEHACPEYLRSGRSRAEPTVVWCLGLLLYEMVAGYLPFDTRDEILHKAPALPDRVSPECRRVVEGCLRKDPVRRMPFSELVCHPWL